MALPGASGYKAAHLEEVLQQSRYDHSCRCWRLRRASQALMSARRRL